MANKHVKRCAASSATGRVMRDHFTPASTATIKNNNTRQQSVGEDVGTPWVGRLNGAAAWEKSGSASDG